MTTKSSPHFISISLTLFLTFFNSACASISSVHPELPTVPHIELNRYLGKWYEIARFDHSFQKGCKDSTAEYSMRKDGDIAVLNSCRKGSTKNKRKMARGRAWIVDPSQNTKLKVQFVLTQWRIPALAGNYWILALDESAEDYGYVLIGEPSRKYLWILSRTPTLDASTYKELVDKAQDLGFETAKLLKN